MSILVHRTECGEKTVHKTMEIVAKVLISTETGDINGAAKVLVPILVGRQVTSVILFAWLNTVFFISLCFPEAYF